MEIKEREALLSALEAKSNILKSEIKLKELEVSELHRQMFDARMIKFSRQELKEWLIKNRPENDYRKNPIVSNGTHATYCYINKEDGELVIGAFGGDDRFPENCELFVPYNFPSWN